MAQSPRQVQQLERANKYDLGGLDNVMYCF